MTDRSAFLERVRAGTAAAPHDPGHGRDSVALGSDEDLVESFVAAAETAAATVHRPQGSADAVDAVLEILGHVRARRFLSWEPGLLPIDGVLPAVEAAGLTAIDARVPVNRADRKNHQLTYFDCDAGITGAQAGLAATGSIVVPSGEGRPRMASLIAGIHIALLERSAIVGSLRHLLASRPDAPGSVANWTVITGPSRTADIEMVITHGVHGPRELHIVLV